jgi:hypothetical protein
LYEKKSGAWVEVLAVTASSTVGQVLRVTGASTYAFGALDLDDTDAVMGTTAVANGGTNLASWATGDLVYASAPTTLAGLADVAVNQVLVSGGVGAAPSYSGTPTVTTLTALTSVTSPTYTGTGAVNITTGGTTNLTINPTGDVVFNPTGNDLLPTTNWDLNIGGPTLAYKTLHAAELWVETLVAQHTIATIGGRIMVGPTSKLVGNLTTTTTDGYLFAHSAFRAGEYALLMADGKFEVIRFATGVYNYPCGDAPGSTQGCYYYFDRNRDGTGANQWYAGDAVFSLGLNVGEGFMQQYAYNSFVARPFQYLHHYNHTGAVFSANEAEEFEVQHWDNDTGVGNEVNDAVYVGADGTFLQIAAWKVVGGAVVAGSATRVWEYWNGSAWTSFSPTNPDVLFDVGSLGKTAVSWTALSGWAATTVNGNSAYWVRNRISVCTTCQIDGGVIQAVTREVQAWGPSIAGMVRTAAGATDWNALEPRWLVGNLNGYYGYGTDVYGLAAGQHNYTWLQVDATTGIKMTDGQGTVTTADDSVMFAMDQNGDAYFRGTLRVGSFGNMIGNSSMIRGRGTGDIYTTFWGGSSETAGTDPNAAYVCTDGNCGQRYNATLIGFDESTASTNWNVGFVNQALYAPMNANAIYMQPTSGTPANTTYSRIMGPVVTVDEDQLYEYSVYVANGGSWTMGGYLIWYKDSNGDGVLEYISEGYVNGFGGTGALCTTGAASPDLGTWCRSWGILDPPATATMVHLGVLSSYDGGDAAPITIFTLPHFQQVPYTSTPHQLTPSPYSVGGMTTITGDMLATELVIANTIRSAGATALSTGAGYWLSSSGTPTFRVGDPAANYLQWNGTTLSVVGTITASAGLIGGWEIGADYLRSAADTVGISSAVTVGDDIRFWAGDTTMASAEFYVTEAGAMVASSFTIDDGDIRFSTAGLELDVNDGGAAFTLDTAKSVEFVADDDGGGFSGLAVSYNSVNGSSGTNGGKVLWLQSENRSTGDDGLIRIKAIGKTGGDAVDTAVIELSGGDVDGADVKDSYIQMNAARVEVVNQMFFTNSVAVSSINEGGIAYNSTYGLVLVGDGAAATYDFTISDAARTNVVFANPAGTDDAYFGATTAVRMDNYVGTANLQVDADGNISTVSDARLKRDIEAFGPGLSAIMALSPVTFRWTEESNLDTDYRYAGFLAQDVQRVIPEAVGQGRLGYLTLSDRGIIAALVNAVQELKREVDLLRGR